MAIRLSDGVEENISFLYYMPEYKDWTFNQEPFHVPSIKSFLAENAVLPEELSEESSLYTFKLYHDTIEIHLQEYRLGINVEAALKVIENETPRFNKKNYVEYYYKYVWDGVSFVLFKNKWEWYRPVVDIRAIIVEPNLELGEEKVGPDLLYWACPNNVDITVSSTLNSSSGLQYSKENMLDLDYKTAWVEGAEEFGLEEEIKFTFKNNVHTNSFVIVNGYDKNKVIWSENNRIKLLSLSINTVPHARIILSDTNKLQRFYLFPQWLSYPEIKRGDRIQFYIEEVYQGEKYDDTAISLFMPEGNCY
jgi:hypothetical protein